MNTLSNLSYVWKASDVINNRGYIDRHARETFGITGIGGKKLKIGNNSYTFSDLKNIRIRKEFESKVLEYLKTHK